MIDDHDVAEQMAHESLDFRRGLDRLRSENETAERQVVLLGRRQAEGQRE